MLTENKPWEKWTGQMKSTKIRAKNRSYLQRNKMNM